jgi:hypothetical protein
MPEFTESNALLAIIRDDEEEAERILREMLPGELAALVNACGLLSSMCRSEARRQRDRRDTA